jgi:hypothetical protein
MTANTRDEDLTPTDEPPASVSQFATQRDVDSIADAHATRPRLLTRRALLVGLGAVSASAWFARRLRGAHAAQPVAGHFSDALRAFSLEPPSSATHLSEVTPPERLVPFPSRRAGAPTGRKFLEEIRTLDGVERERPILRELRAGNVPDFLRRFVAVPVHRERDGGGRAVVYVLPDYLAIGTDEDFLRIPMMPSTAQTLADELGCVMPTRAVVDAIYEHAEIKLEPQPLGSGPEMMTSAEFAHHNELIERQRLAAGARLGALIAGHKKDVVISARLARRFNRVAIYGMHRHGTPIQSLSTLHRTLYVDYAHGVRLVSDEMLLDGEARRVTDVLADPELAATLSDEGVIESPRYRTKRRAQ